MDPQTATLMNKTRKALIIEDENSIAQLLKINLTHLAFTVDHFTDAESAFAGLQSQKYDLCLLDWMLPKIQGIDFLKRIRPHFPHLKIMMVTAKADADSLVNGLESGADDYLTKPFDSKVLSARVRNLMRRLDVEENFKPQMAKEEPDEMVIESARIHFSKYEISVSNEFIHLTPSEFKLLASLFKARGKVLTRDQLINQIQGEDVTVTGRTIDTHVFALRKKMGTWSPHIETIRGVGYRVLLSLEDRSEQPE